MFKNNFLLERKTMWILMLIINLIFTAIIFINQKSKELKELGYKTLDF